MSADRWIVIPHWDRYQHYKEREPKWIKDHRNQYDSDEYLALTFHQRGVLAGIRHSYAASNRQLSDSTLTLTRRLGQRVLRRDLEALNHAGFIAFVASKPLAHSYQDASPEEETETEVETEKIVEQDQELALSKQPSKNGHADEYDPYDTPAFALLHLAVGPTPENLEKLHRAGRGLPTAAIVNAREAAQGPGVNDPLAVALAELSKAKQPAAAEQHTHPT